jgi:hypothetical protein
LAPAGRPCAAPYSSLYFQPDGIVKTCCATGYVLGRYRGSEGPSLREIWDGARLQRHRDALDAGDFSLGCQECELPLASGNRDQTLARHFDRFDVPGPYDFPRIIDFAVSSACNLQCIMCNGELSSSIRAHRDHLPPLVGPYDDAFFEQLREFIPRLERAQFKGGEPFLSRSTQRIWDLMLELGVPAQVAVTTNATIWNERVEHYVRSLRMHPIISVDAVSHDVFESVRVGADGARVWRNVDRFGAVAEETGAGMTLSFCLMPQTWRELGPFLLEVERRGVSGNVILVNQPAHCDLTKLPTAELRSVVRELERQGDEIRPLLHANGTLWDGYLGRLRDQLRRPSELRVSVAPVPEAKISGGGSLYVGERADDPAASDSSVQRRVLSSEEARTVEDEVRAWASRDPVVVTSVGNVVLDVEAPPWAGWLAPERWIGAPLEAVTVEIERVVDRVAYDQADDDGVIRVDGSMGLPGGDLAFRSRAMVCRDHEGRPVARVLLATRDDPPRSPAAI